MRLLQLPHKLFSDFVPKVLQAVRELIGLSIVFCRNFTMLDMPLPVFDIAERAKDKPDVIHSASTQVSSFYVVIDVFLITYYA